MADQTSMNAPASHVVHASLYRPILFVGVEFGVLVAEATTVLALLFVIGVHLGTVGLAVVYALGVHAAAAWATARDPQITNVYVRALLRRAYYPPFGSGDRALRVEGAIPKVR